MALVPCAPYHSPPQLPLMAVFECESYVLSLSAHNRDPSQDDSHKLAHWVGTLFHGGKCAIAAQQHRASGSFLAL